MNAIQSHRDAVARYRLTEKGKKNERDRHMRFAVKKRAERIARNTDLLNQIVNQGVAL